MTSRAHAASWTHFSLPSPSLPAVPKNVHPMSPKSHPTPPHPVLPFLLHHLIIFFRYPPQQTHPHEPYMAKGRKRERERESRVTTHHNLRFEREKDSSKEQSGGSSPVNGILATMIPPTGAVQKDLTLSAT
jgi:hypothetical protein